MSVDNSAESEVTKPTPRKPSLKINVVSNWFTLCTNIGIGLFLTPAIIAHLDEKRFGMWLLASSVVGYFGFLQFGVGTGVLRYIPLYRGAGDKTKVSSIVSTAMALYVGMGLLVFIVSWCFAGLFSNFFGGGPEFALLVRAVGLAAALQFPVIIFSAAIKGYEGFVYANLVGLISAITRAIALFGCIMLGYGLVTMGWALVIVNIVTVLAGWSTFTYYCSDVKLSLRSVHLGDLKILLLFGLTIMACGLAELLIYETPKLIIGKSISLEAVGFFGIAALLVSYYRRAIYAITKVFMPRFSYLYGHKMNEEINRLYLRGSKYATIVTGAIAVLTLSLGQSFLRLWLKENFNQQTVTALMILIGGALVLLSHRMSVDLMYGLGKQVYIGVIDIIEGVAVFVLCLILAYKYGLTGVAIGASIPVVLMRITVQIVYVCRLVNISSWKYYATCILKPWIIVLTLAIINYSLGIAKIADSWGKLFVTSGVIIITYGVVVFAIVLQREERFRFRSRVLAGLSKHFKNRGVIE